MQPLTLPMGLSNITARISLQIKGNRLTRAKVEDVALSPGNQLIQKNNRDMTAVNEDKGNAAVVQSSAKDIRERRLDEAKEQISWRLLQKSHNPTPIHDLIGQFTMNTKYIFLPEFLPSGSKEKQRSYIYQAKFEFLKKHLSEELNIKQINGKWTYCKNRASVSTLRKLLRIQRKSAKEILPFAKKTRKQVRRLLKTGDPAFDGIYERTTKGKKSKTKNVKNVTQKNADTTIQTQENRNKKKKKKKKKTKKKQDQPKSDNSAEAEPTELPYNCVPIAYALVNFAKKFQLAFSCRGLSPTMTTRKRHTMIRTQKFRFLKKHFRSALRIKKVGENWTCCQIRFDDLNPVPVIQKINPRLLMPFVPLSAAESLALLQEPAKTGVAHATVRNGPKANTPHWSLEGEHPELLTHNSLSPNEKTNQRQGKSFQSPIKADDGFLEVLSPPPRVPVPVVVLSDSESTVNTPPPSPEKQPSATPLTNHEAEPEYHETEAESTHWLTEQMEEQDEDLPSNDLVGVWVYPKSRFARNRDEPQPVISGFSDPSPQNKINGGFETESLAAHVPRAFLIDPSVPIHDIDNGTKTKTKSKRKRQKSRVNGETETDLLAAPVPPPPEPTVIYDNLVPTYVDDCSNVERKRRPKRRREKQLNGEAESDPRFAAVSVSPLSGPSFITVGRMPTYDNGSAGTKTKSKRKRERNHHLNTEFQIESNAAPVMGCHQPGPVPNSPQRGPVPNSPQRGPVPNSPQRGPVPNSPSRGPVPNSPSPGPSSLPVDSDLIPNYDSAFNGVRKRSSKRKRQVLYSSDDEPPPPRPRPSSPIFLKPCHVTLNRLSPPGLRETREYKTYKRIRANKPFVVEDARRLMIGTETIRQRLNSESESDIEFDPKRVGSSDDASSCSESVLSNETDSPVSPDTEESGGPHSEEYGASELEEEEERHRHLNKRYAKPFIVQKTVEEKLHLREKRKQNLARKMERKRSRKEYVRTFMGHLSYAPASLRYAVDMVTKKLKWDVFPYGAKILGRTLGKKELDSLSKAQESTEWTVLKQAFVLKHFREAFRINKNPKGGEWTCCKNTVDFLDCRAFLKLFWNITVT